MTDNPLRDLPQVDVLAAQIEASIPHPIRVALAREALDVSRSQIRAGGDPDPTALARALARAHRGDLGTVVINASGVLLHTNLGRARWSQTAIAAAQTAAGEATNLELDLATGERGNRGSGVARLLTTLTGAEDALVTNNNASALFLSLAASAAGRATIVARGEMIEIGGSYRLPDVMAASGTKMVEIGTTNRVRRGDYETAAQLHETGAILKIHPSNYTVEGFTEETTISELADLCGDAVLIHDLGSGLLDSQAQWVPDWLRGEPGVRQSLAEGADLALFSGDKLLGGPQSGIVVGTGEAIDTLRTHPLARALRVDAVTLAALQVTLAAYFDPSPTTIPFWAQALAPFDEIEARSEALASRIGAIVEPGASAVGGGSAPGAQIPSPVVRIVGRDDLFLTLLDLDVPVLGRRESGDLILDLRAADVDRDEELAESLSKCL